MGSGARTATLWAGIAFCVVVLAMSVSVAADIEVEEWTIGTFLLIAFLVGGVAIIGMIMLALISALRNPPDE
ncbi:MAG TPA: hypothetical protein VHF58_07495 [Solirubrobacterales bacterium]|nr:hypothetical protein [Solirubrobacterales bacterium]